MSPILVVDDDYTVYYLGRKLGLCSPLQLEVKSDYFRYPYDGSPRIQFSFGCVELPPPPPPKPKRTVRDLGLRKPKGGAR